MNFWVYIIAVGISFLASLTAYFQQNTRVYLRLFPFFLLLTISIEVFSNVLPFKVSPTTITILYNFFTSFEFLFYMYVLREIIQNKRSKKIILNVSCFYLVLVILNLLFFHKITPPHPLSYSFPCLLSHPPPLSS